MFFLITGQPNANNVKETTNHDVILLVSFYRLTHNSLYWAQWNFLCSFCSQHNSFPTIHTVFILSDVSRVSKFTSVFPFNYSRWQVL